MILFQPNNITTKFISTLTSFFFLTNSALAYAGDVGVFRHAPTQSSEIQLENPFKGIAIPEAFGRTGDVHLAGGSMFVVHIQDAHAEPDAQRNIEKILNYLANRHGFKTLCLEGAHEGLVSGDLLRFFQDDSVNQKIAEELLESGEVTAGGLFLLTQGENARVYGGELPSRYHENLELFRSVYRHEREAKAFLAQSKLVLEALASKRFNPKLRGFLKGWLLFQDDRQSLISHLENLKSASLKHLNFDLEDVRNQIDFPQLVRFFKLKELEKQTSGRSYRVAVEMEREALKTWIQKAGLAPVYQDSFEAIFGDRKEKQPADIRGFLESFYRVSEPHGFSFKRDYPHLARELGKRVIAQELEADRFFSEIHALTVKLIGKLVKTREEKRLVRLFRDRLLLAKLLKLELTRDELELLMRRQSALLPSRFLAKIARFSGDLSRTAEMSSGLDRPFSEAIRFYEVAQEREKIIFENLKRAAKASGENKIILTTGGFHTEGLERLFRENGISFLTIMPRIESLNGSAAYRKLMLFDQNVGHSTVIQETPGLIPVPAMTTPAAEHYRRRLSDVTLPFDVDGRGPAFGLHQLAVDRLKSRRAPAEQLKSQPDPPHSQKQRRRSELRGGKDAWLINLLREEARRRYEELENAYVVPNALSPALKRFRQIVSFSRLAANQPLFLEKVRKGLESSQTIGEIFDQSPFLQENGKVEVGRTPEDEFEDFGVFSDPFFRIIRQYGGVLFQDTFFRRIPHNPFRNNVIYIPGALSTFLFHRYVRKNGQLKMSIRFLPTRQIRMFIERLGKAITEETVKIIETIRQESGDPDLTEVISEAGDDGVRLIQHLLKKEVSTRNSVVDDLVLLARHLEQLKLFYQDIAQHWYPDGKPIPRSELRNEKVREVVISERELFHFVKALVDVVTVTDSLKFLASQDDFEDFIRQLVRVFIESGVSENRGAKAIAPLLVEKGVGEAGQPARLLARALRRVWNEKEELGGLRFPPKVTAQERASYPSDLMQQVISKIRVAYTETWLFIYVSQASKHFFDFRKRLKTGIEPNMREAFREEVMEEVGSFKEALTKNWFRLTISDPMAKANKRCAGALVKIIDSFREDFETCPFESWETRIAGLESSMDSLIWKAAYKEAVKLYLEAEKLTNQQHPGDWLDHFQRRIAATKKTKGWAPFSEMVQNATDVYLNLENVIKRIDQSGNSDPKVLWLRQVLDMFEETSGMGAREILDVVRRGDALPERLKEQLWKKSLLEAMVIFGNEVFIPALLNSKAISIRLLEVDERMEMLWESDVKRSGEWDEYVKLLYEAEALGETVILCKLVGERNLGDLDDVSRFRDFAQNAFRRWISRGDRRQAGETLRFDTEKLDRLLAEAHDPGKRTEFVAQFLSGKSPEELQKLIADYKEDDAILYGQVETGFEPQAKLAEKMGLYYGASNVAADEEIAKKAGEIYESYNAGVTGSASELAKQIYQEAKKLLLAQRKEAIQRHVEQHPNLDSTIVVAWNLLQFRTGRDQYQHRDSVRAKGKILFLNEDPANQNFPYLNANELARIPVFREFSEEEFFEPMKTLRRLVNDYVQDGGRESSLPESYLKPLEGFERLRGFLRDLILPRTEDNRSEDARGRGLERNRSELRSARSSSRMDSWTSAQNPLGSGAARPKLREPLSASAAPMSKLRQDRPGPGQLGSRPVGAMSELRAEAPEEWVKVDFGWFNSYEVFGKNDFDSLEIYLVDHDGQMHKQEVYVLTVDRKGLKLRDVKSNKVYAIRHNGSRVINGHIKINDFGGKDGKNGFVQLWTLSGARKKWKSIRVRRVKELAGEEAEGQRQALKKEVLRDDRGFVLLGFDGSARQIAFEKNRLPVTSLTLRDDAGEFSERYTVRLKREVVCLNGFEIPLHGDRKIGHHFRIVNDTNYILFEPVESLQSVAETLEVEWFYLKPLHESVRSTMWKQEPEGQEDFPLGPSTTDSDLFRKSTLRSFQIKLIGFDGKEGKSYKVDVDGNDLLVTDEKTEKSVTVLNGGDMEIENCILVDDLGDSEGLFRIWALAQTREKQRWKAVRIVWKQKGRPKDVVWQPLGEANQWVLDLWQSFSERFRRWWREERAAIPTFIQADILEHYWAAPILRGDIQPAQLLLFVDIKTARSGVGYVEKISGRGADKAYFIRWLSAAGVDGWLQFSGMSHPATRVYKILDPLVVKEYGLSPDDVNVGKLLNEISPKVFETQPNLIPYKESPAIELREKDGSASLGYEENDLRLVALKKAGFRTLKVVFRDAHGREIAWFSIQLWESDVDVFELDENGMPRQFSSFVIPPKKTFVGDYFRVSNGRRRIEFELTGHRPDPELAAAEVAWEFEPPTSNSRNSRKPRRSELRQSRSRRAQIDRVLARITELREELSRSRDSDKIARARLKIYLWQLKLLNLMGILTKSKRAFNLLSGSDWFPGLYVARMWTVDERLDKEVAGSVFAARFYQTAHNLVRGSGRGILPSSKHLGAIRHERMDVVTQDGEKLDRLKRKIKPGDVVFLKFAIESLNHWRASEGEIRGWVEWLIQALPEGTDIVIFDSARDLNILRHGLAYQFIRSGLYENLGKQLLTENQWRRFQRANRGKTWSALEEDYDRHNITFLFGGRLSILKKITHGTTSEKKMAAEQRSELRPELPVSAETLGPSGASAESVHQVSGETLEAPALSAKGGSGIAMSELRTSTEQKQPQGEAAADLILPANWPVISLQELKDMQVKGAARLDKRDLERLDEQLHLLDYFHGSSDKIDPTDFLFLEVVIDFLIQFQEEVKKADLNAIETIRDRNLMDALDHATRHAMPIALDHAEELDHKEVYKTLRDRELKLTKRLKLSNKLLDAAFYRSQSGDKEKKIRLLSLLLYRNLERNLAELKDILSLIEKDEAVPRKVIDRYRQYIAANHLILMFYSRHVNADRQAAQNTKGPLELTEYVDSFVTVIQEFYRDVEIEFVQVGKGQILADVKPDDLFWIFVNLTENAVDAVKGRDKPKVAFVLEVTSDNVDRRVRMQVRDNGIGMALEQIKTIWQGHSTKEEGHGKGLGLVKTMVERNGGNISVISARGSGTEFTIALPLSEAHTSRAELRGDKKAKPINVPGEDGLRGGASADRPRTYTPAQWLQAQLGLSKLPFYFLFLAWSLFGNILMLNVTNNTIATVNAIFQELEKSLNNRVAKPAVPINWANVIADLAMNSLFALLISKFILAHPRLSVKLALQTNQYFTSYFVYSQYIFHLLAINQGIEKNARSELRQVKQGIGFRIIGHRVAPIPNSEIPNPNNSRSELRQGRAGSGRSPSPRLAARAELGRTERVLPQPDLRPPDAMSELRSMSAEAHQLFQFILRAARDYAAYQRYIVEKGMGANTPEEKIFLDSYLESRDLLNEKLSELQELKNVAALMEVFVNLVLGLQELNERKDAFLDALVSRRPIAKDEGKESPDGMWSQMFEEPHFRTKLEEFRDHIRSLQDGAHATWKLPAVEVAVLGVGHIPREWTDEQSRRMNEKPSGVLTLAIMMALVKNLNTLLPGIIEKFAGQENPWKDGNEHREEILLRFKGAPCYLSLRKTENERVIDFEISGLISPKHRLARGKAILSRSELRQSRPGSGRSPSPRLAARAELRSKPSGAFRLSRGQIRRIKRFLNKEDFDLMLRPELPASDGAAKVPGREAILKRAKENFLYNMEQLMTLENLTQQAVADFVSPHIVRRRGKAHAGMVSHWLRRRFISHENARKVAKLLLGGVFKGESDEKLLARLVGCVHLTAGELREIFTHQSGVRGIPGRFRIALAPEAVGSLVGRLFDPFDFEVLARKSPKELRRHLLQNAFRVQEAAGIALADIVREVGVTSGTVGWWKKGKMHKGSYLPPTIRKKHVFKLAQFLLAPYFDKPAVELIVFLATGFWVQTDLARKAVQLIFPKRVSRKRREDGSKRQPATGVTLRTIDAAEVNEVIQPFPQPIDSEAVSRELARELKHHFLQNAAALRRTNGISRYQAAKTIGVSVWTMKWWEEDRTSRTREIRASISRTNAFRYARFLIGSAFPDEPGYQLVARVSGVPELAEEAILKIFDDKHIRGKQAARSELRVGLSLRGGRQADEAIPEGKSRLLRPSITGLAMTAKGLATKYEIDSTPYNLGPTTGFRRSELRSEFNNFDTPFRSGRSELRRTETSPASITSWLTNIATADWDRVSQSQKRFLINVLLRAAGETPNDLAEDPDRASKLFHETPIDLLGGQTLGSLYDYYEKKQKETGRLYPVIQFILFEAGFNFESREEIDARELLGKNVPEGQKKLFTQATKDINLPEWLRLFETNQAKLFFLMQSRFPAFNQEALLKLLSQQFWDMTKTGKGRFFTLEELTGMEPVLGLLGNSEETRKVLEKQICSRIYNYLVTESEKNGRDRVADRAIQLAIGWFNQRLEDTQALLSEETRKLYRSIRDYYQALADGNYQQYVRNRKRGLPGGLKLYQIEGIHFALENKRVIVGDEMGLGKTLQAIATAEAARSERVLIIAPKTLMMVWKNEIEKWLGASEDVLVLSGSISGKLKKLRQAHSGKKRARFIIVNYDSLRDPAVVSELNAWKPDLKINDEAQRLRNYPKTQESRGDLAIHAERILHLSGTSIVNHELDLWPLLYDIAPETFGDRKDFERYSKDALSFVELNLMLSNRYMLRRNIADVVTDLPKKHPVKFIPVSLDAAQQAVYEEALSYYYTHSGQIAILAAQEKMRQILIDLELYDSHRFSHEDPPKLQSAVQLALELIAKGDKVIIGSRYNHVIRRLQEKLAEALKGKNESVADAKAKYISVVHAQQSTDQRDEAVEAFQNDPAKKVFLATYPIGGYGLTLTSANHYIFVDLPYTKEQMEQASARPYREGQTKEVHVYAFYVEGTLDEDTIKILNRKETVFDQVVRGMLSMENRLKTEQWRVAQEIHKGIGALTEAQKARSALEPAYGASLRGDVEASKQAWEDAAKIYSENIKGLAAFPLSQAHWLLLLLLYKEGRIKLDPKSRWLFAPAGPATDLRALATVEREFRNAGLDIGQFSFTDVDFSREMLVQGTKALEPLGMSRNTNMIDLTDQELPLHQFDVVNSSELWGFSTVARNSRGVSHRNWLLGQLVRAAKPGGLLLLWAHAQRFTPETKKFLQDQFGLEIVAQDGDAIPVGDLPKEIGDKLGRSSFVLVRTTEKTGEIVNRADYVAYLRGLSPSGLSFTKDERASSVLSARMPRAESPAAEGPEGRGLPDLVDWEDGFALGGKPPVAYPVTRRDANLQELLGKAVGLLRGPPDDHLLSGLNGLVSAILENLPTAKFLTQVIRFLDFVIAQKQAEWQSFLGGLHRVRERVVRARDTGVQSDFESRRPRSKQPVVSRDADREEASGLGQPPSRRRIRSGVIADLDILDYLKERGDAVFVEGSERVPSVMKREQSTFFIDPYLLHEWGLIGSDLQFLLQLAAYLHVDLINQKKAYSESKLYETSLAYAGLAILKSKISERGAKDRFLAILEKLDPSQTDLFYFLMDLEKLSALQKPATDEEWKLVLSEYREFLVKYRLGDDMSSFDPHFGTYTPAFEQVEKTCEELLSAIQSRRKSLDAARDGRMAAVLGNDADVRRGKWLKGEELYAGRDSFELPMDELKAGVLVEIRSPGVRYGKIVRGQTRMDDRLLVRLEKNPEGLSQIYYYPINAKSGPWSGRVSKYGKRVEGMTYPSAGESEIKEDKVKMLKFAFRGRRLQVELDRSYVEYRRTRSIIVYQALFKPNTASDQLASQQKAPEVSSSKESAGDRNTSFAQNKWTRGEELYRGTTEPHLVTFEQLKEGVIVDVRLKGGERKIFARFPLERWLIQRDSSAREKPWWIEFFALKQSGLVSGEAKTNQPVNVHNFNDPFKGTDMEAKEGDIVTREKVGDIVSAFVKGKGVQISLRDRLGENGYELAVYQAKRVPAGDGDSNSVGAEEEVPDWAQMGTWLKGESIDVGTGPFELGLSQLEKGLMVRVISERQDRKSLKSLFIRYFIVRAERGEGGFHRVYFYHPVKDHGSPYSSWTDRFRCRRAMQVLDLANDSEPIEIKTKRMKFTISGSKILMEGTFPHTRLGLNRVKFELDGTSVSQKESPQSSTRPIPQDPELTEAHQIIEKEMPMVATPLSSLEPFDFGEAARFAWYHMKRKKDGAQENDLSQLIIMFTAAFSGKVRREIQRILVALFPSFADEIFSGTIDFHKLNDEIYRERQLAVLEKQRPGILPLATGFSDHPIDLETAWYYVRKQMGSPLALTPTITRFVSIILAQADTEKTPPRFNARSEELLKLDFIQKHGDKFGVNDPQKINLVISRSKRLSEDKEFFTVAINRINSRGQEEWLASLGTGFSPTDLQGRWHLYQVSREFAMLPSEVKRGKELESRRLAGMRLGSDPNQHAVLDPDEIPEGYGVIIHSGDHASSLVMLNPENPFELIVFELGSSLSTQGKRPESAFGLLYDRSVFNTAVTGYHHLTLANDGKIDVRPNLRENSSAKAPLRLYVTAEPLFASGMPAPAPAEDAVLTRSELRQEVVSRETYFGFRPPENTKSESRNTRHEIRDTKPKSELRIAIKVAREVTQNIVSQDLLLRLGKTVLSEWFPEVFAAEQAPLARGFLESMTSLGWSDSTENSFPLNLFQFNPDGFVVVSADDALFEGEQGEVLFRDLVTMLTRFRRADRKPWFVIAGDGAERLEKIARREVESTDLYAAVKFSSLEFAEAAKQEGTRNQAAILAPSDDLAEALHGLLFVVGNGNGFEQLSREERVTTAFSLILGLNRLSAQARLDKTKHENGYLSLIRSVFEGFSLESVGNYFRLSYAGFWSDLEKQPAIKQLISSAA